MPATFLKLAGIEGESSDAKHKGEIDVLAWSWRLSQEAGCSAGGGGRAGRTTLKACKGGGDFLLFKMAQVIVMAVSKYTNQPAERGSLPVSGRSNSTTARPSRTAAWVPRNPSSGTLPRSSRSSVCADAHVDARPWRAKTGGERPFDIRSNQLRKSSSGSCWHLRFAINGWITSRDLSMA